MTWDAVVVIAEVVGAVGVIISLLMIAKQMKEQTQRSSHDAYYRAMNLMVDNWAKMNAVLSSAFYPYDQWSEDERKQADEVCHILHQLGAAVEQQAVPVEIGDVYFYTIPKLHEKLAPHIRDRRNPESPHYRSTAYYWAFDSLAEMIRERNRVKGRNV